MEKENRRRWRGLYSLLWTHTHTQTGARKQCPKRRGQSNGRLKASQCLRFFSYAISRAKDEHGRRIDDRKRPIGPWLCVLKRQSRQEKQSTTIVSEKTRKKQYPHHQVNQPIRKSHAWTNQPINQSIDRSNTDTTALWQPTNQSINQSDRTNKSKQPSQPVNQSINWSTVRQH